MHPVHTLDSSDRARGIATRSSRTNRVLALEQLAIDQIRVVRRDQLAALGWSRHHIAREIAIGRWHRVAAEVIALQNAPLTHAQRLWLGVLHGGKGAALSHGTTLQVLGLKHWEPAAIDVLVAKSHTLDRLPGFFFHETRRPYLEWVHPARTPPQLRVEHACLLAAERQRRLRAGIGMIAAVVQQGLAQADQLFATSLTINKLRHGHPFRLALLDIQGGAHSFAEIDVGRLCREHGLAPPTRQVFRLDSSGRRRYLDCVWELPDGTTLVLEIDGAFHMEVGSWWRDLARERGLVVTTGRVVRCSTLELRYEGGQVMRDLRRLGVPLER